MVTAVIQVRMNSKRLPGKAMMDLAGRPVIHRVYERVSLSKLCRNVIINTPDQEIIKYCKKQGIPVVKARDELDVIARLLCVDDETIVRVTGDNPLTDPIQMDYQIEKHLEQGPDYTYTDFMPRGTKSEVINVMALQELYESLRRKSQFYVHAAGEYLTYELMRFKRLKVPNIINRSNISYTIDTHADLVRVRQIYEYYNGSPPSLAELVLNSKSSSMISGIDG